MRDIGASSGNIYLKTGRTRGLAEQSSSPTRISGDISSNLNMTRQRLDSHIRSSE